MGWKRFAAICVVFVHKIIAVVVGRKADDIAGINRILNLASYPRLLQFKKFHGLVV
jgi:hypothetical protein